MLSLCFSYIDLDCLVPKNVSVSTALEFFSIATFHFLCITLSLFLRSWPFNLRVRLASGISQRTSVNGLSYTLFQVSHTFSNTILQAALSIPFFFEPLKGISISLSLSDIKVVTGVFGVEENRAVKGVVNNTGVELGFGVVAVNRGVTANDEVVVVDGGVAASKEVDDERQIADDREFADRVEDEVTDDVVTVSVALFESKS